MKSNQTGIISLFLNYLTECEENLKNFKARIQGYLEAQDDLKKVFLKGQQDYKKALNEEKAKTIAEQKEKALAEIEEIEKAIKAGTFQYPELHKASKKKKQRRN